MNLDQLKIISTISETGSLTSAAKKLLRSPSAISLNLKNLEEEWGIEIFDRSQYRLKLTRHGEEALTRINKILSEANQLEEYIKNLGDGPEASLKICIHKVFPFEHIENILKLIKKKFPNTLIYISVKEKYEPKSLLENKEVDLAISLEPLMESDNFESIPIYELNLIPVVSPALISKPNIDKEKLESFTQIVTGEYKKEDIGNAGIEKGESKWSVTDVSTKKRLILQGLGYGLLPKYLIEKELKSGKLIELKKLERRSFNFTMARHHEASIGPVKEFILKEVTKIN